MAPSELSVTYYPQRVHYERCPGGKSKRLTVSGGNGIFFNYANETNGVSMRADGGDGRDLCIVVIRFCSARRGNNVVFQLAE